MRRWLTVSVAFLVLALGFGRIYRVKQLYDGDPDRYYHMALSRLAVESGRPFLRSVPQVEGLGWGDYFIDKEFLFHEVTNAGYAIAGDRGVEMASFACSLLAILIFFLYASGRIPLTSAFAITILTFGSPYLLFRMSLLRPHTLAVATFVAMCTSLLARRPRLTALATALFVLSYHAFYVSLFCMGVLFALSFLEPGEDRKAWQRVSLFGAFGCLAGVLVNPYFPGNIVLAIIHMRIPELMQGELRGASFGDELVPVRADQHLSMFGGPLLVLLLAVLVFGFEVGRRGRIARTDSVRLLYLLGVGGFFFGVSFQIARAGEYLIPLCGLILVWLCERLPAPATEPAGWWRDYRRLAGFAAVALVFVQSAFVWHIWRTRITQPSGDRVAETFKAIAAIPAEAKGAKIFNCEWDRTPYIFYARPDLRFIDIMDPSLLYFADRGAYKSREDLLKGVLADAHGLIRNAFHADFVFCSDPTTSAQLRGDPGFQQIYPAIQNPGQPYIVPSVFRVLPDEEKQFARNVEVSPLLSLDNEKMLHASPPSPAEPRRNIDLDRTPYLNLSALLPGKYAAGDAHCAFVAPSKEELARLQGADFLGVGGGPGLKVWRNGKPFFTTRAGLPSSHEVQVLLPLPAKLKADDRIEVFSCSAESSPFWGVAISFWTRDGIRQACQLKKAALKAPASDPASWPYEGLQLLTCLAPVAAPEQTRALGQIGLRPETR